MSGVQAARSWGKRLFSSSATWARISAMSLVIRASKRGSSAAQPSRSFMVRSAIAWSSSSLSAMLSPSGRCSRTAGYRYDSSATECRTSSMIAWSA